MNAVAQVAVRDAAVGVGDYDGRGGCAEARGPRGKGVVDLVDGSVGAEANGKDLVDLEIGVSYRF